MNKEEIWPLNVEEIRLKKKKPRGEDKLNKTTGILGSVLLTVCANDSCAQQYFAMCIHAA